MAAPIANMPLLALRGSQGVWMSVGPPTDEECTEFPRSTRNSCKVMTYSKDGSLFAFCDFNKIRVISLDTFTVIAEISKPRTAFLEFSPLNNILAAWEPYMVTKDQPAGTPNLELFDVKTGSLIKGFVQKKQYGWCPQWSADEGICARNVNNEIHFFEKNNFSTIQNKLHLQKVSDFSLPPAKGHPYHVAAYVPGSKGQPSFVRLYRYPDFGGPNSALGNKSFYKADKVDLLWNNRGSAVLVLAATESSVDSYYGDQGLHFIDTKGESCLVPRGKNGPVYCVQWNPNSQDFCVVYGFMPAKVTLFNLKCEAIFDFGTGPRNLAYYNPQGNILCLAGFGNLRGNMEFWDVKNKKLISNPQAPDTTYFEWSSDGMHVVTATLAPRLRVGNGYKLWHYTGSLLLEKSVGSDQELWETTWQKALDGKYPEPRISYRPIETAQPQPETTKSAYVPPAMRNRPQSQQTAKGPKYREAYEPPSNVKQAATEPENMSKAALKNKKKREAKARAKQENTETTTSEARETSSGGAMASTGDPEVDKKIKNVKKKLQQIEKLKDQQASGKTLEKNQLDKLGSEAALLKELSDLQI